MGLARCERPAPCPGRAGGPAQWGAILLPVGDHPVFRLPHFPRPAAHAARARLARPVRHAHGAAGAALAVAGCAGGAIGQDTPVSGTNFVAGSYSSTVYANGSGPVAPDVKGTTLAGRKFALAADRGDVVVLNFWGSWCAP